MKKYELKIYPDPVLRKIALPVNKIDHVTRHLLKNMSEIMYAHRAIGLAAPQVGALKRVVITDIGKGLILMINPEILTGFGEDQMEEGCLSLPDTTVNVRRKETLLVRYIDKYEKEKEREFKGLTARVIQHEIDHINGVLIIDHGRIIDRLLWNRSDANN
ncbi:MAG: peptide deformylase [Ignavibacteria bacterium GWA2_35_9]|nr:MAG: peptide deformylase [Ignavibacteria bacterium GWA2_35_9]